MQNNSHYIAGLIKRQWIRKEYVPTDLFTIDVLDEDFVGGYRPMILTMELLVDIIIGEVSFLSMPDTPDTYQGASGMVPVVNSAEDGLEFIDYVNTFLELTDTPTDYSGYAGYNVVVNQAEDALEFSAPVVLTPHYEARLTFNGAIDPVETLVLENTTGLTVTPTHVSTGQFKLTFNNPVIVNKIVAILGTSNTGQFYIHTYSTTTIEFEHRNFSGALTDPISLVYLEIKKYL